MTATPIAESNRSFLEKVKNQGKLSDLYDARDLSEIVFRVMRDLMTEDTINRVDSELHEEAVETDNKTLQTEISDLWKDSNPLVGWLSRIRPPFKAPPPAGIDDNLFITRVEQEGGLPPTTSGETLIKAVFSATKDELSEDRIREVAGCLPGKVRQLWEQA